MDDIDIRNFAAILREELTPAMGCTEPIAIAFAAAKAKRVLGCMPERAVVWCSGNIVKNVLCVYVPNTAGCKGIRASVVAGFVGGDPDLGMQVLSGMTDAEGLKVKALVDELPVDIRLLEETDARLHIRIRAEAGSHSAEVEVMHLHTNVVGVVRDGEVLFAAKPGGTEGQAYATDRSRLCISEICEFASAAPLDILEELFAEQIANNMAIADEGMRGGYGLGIGEVLLSSGAGDPWTTIKAYAAAASEARMGGCPMPVTTNSGSGNQGIVASVPVILYARLRGLSDESLYRALALSNLFTIHQKAAVGRLSAFCSAVFSAGSAMAAICYLSGGGLREMGWTITNTLANVTGLICDGAKPSCGAKISSCLDGAILGYHAAMLGRVYGDDTGILKASIEDTIGSVCRMARVGMKNADREILDIMLGK